ncbi:Galactoside 3(4)-L-fucosyltransferase [Armadillidium vulgare]|nr:Galactoside 3(4)-L-fucosyltransferase [Armadillidium vulgare]
MTYGHVFSKKRWPDTFITTLERKSLPLEELVKMKTKLVVWMASNCHTHSNREFFVKQLQRYIDVNRRIRRLWKTEMSKGTKRKMLTKSLRKHYKYNMVPVVLGGGDYSSMAPPHSYINARNFKNALELATYLKYLDSNNTAYMEYFRWKDNYVADERVLARKLGICTLCQKLHEENEVKVYEDMKNWYYEQSNCIECSEGKLKRNKNCYRENIIF